MNKRVTFLCVLLIMCSFYIFPAFSDSITYTVDGFYGNVITVTGFNQSVPCNFSQLSDADLAGSLQLLAPTNASADLSLDTQIQPADDLALKLTLNISNLAVANWLGVWSYRKNHTINSASGAGTNYQVKIIVVNGSDADSGDTVYIDNKTRSDFGDIRFTDDDGTTLLDYWMEELNSGDNATFWVEIADSLSSSNVEIFMYYGNSGASTTSDGDKTFLLFDHFLGVSLNMSKWNETASGGSYSVSGSVLTVTGGAGAWEAIGSITQFSYPIAMEAYGNMTESARLFLGLDDRSKDGNYIGASVDQAHWGFLVATKVYRRSNNVAPTDIARTSTLTSLTRFTIEWQSGKVEWYENGVSKASGTTNVPSDNMGPMFWARELATNVQVDWVAIRKFVDPQPSHGNWGTEETPSGVGSVSLTGKDKDDGVQTETVTVTQNTTYTTSEWFKSIDSQGVDCTGNFTLEITQPRWGIIWRTGNSFTLFNKTSIFIGDGGNETWYADENIQIESLGTSTVYPFYLFNVANSSHFRLGRLDSSSLKITSHGVSILTTNVSATINAQNGSIIEIYQSFIQDTNADPIPPINLRDGCNSSIYHSKITSILYMSVTWGGSHDWYDVSVDNTQEGLTIYGTYGILLTNITMENVEITNVLGADGLYLYELTENVTIENLYMRNINNDTFNLDYTLGNHTFLINPDVDSWTFEWVGDNLDSRVYRQYDFDLTVQFPNGTVVDGANVTLSHAGQGGGTDYSGQTNSSGQIPTQTLTMGFYNATGGNTIYNYNNYSLTVTEDGYQTYTKNFTLSTKTDWTIALQESSTAWYFSGFVILAIILIPCVTIGLFLVSKKR